MPALLSYPDFTLTSTLSGGSWQASAPLTNLQDPMLSRVARSSNANAASSIILVDLGASYNIGVISLCLHNITAQGLIKVTSWIDATYSTTLNSSTGFVAAWPNGFSDRDVADYPKNWTFCFPGGVTARYWKVEILNTTNPAGYIELGRCWFGISAFAPATPWSKGLTLGYESRDVTEESLGGVFWGERRTPRRTLVAKFDFLSPAEKRQALIMQKALSETSEAFWVSDTAASANDMLLEAFPCYISKPSPLVYPFYNNSELPISIIERV